MRAMKALITGYTGQDGTFLTKLLIDKGYQVVGLVRRISTEPPHRVRGNHTFIEQMLSGQLVLESGDLNSVESLIKVFKKHKIDEVYNLAAQSDVRISFDQPELTAEINYLGVMNLITVMRHFAPEARLYQASTSELFGQSESTLQNEKTPFEPASPYAVAKLAAHYTVINYRKEGHFACCGILFNHESELRGGNFVTRKITKNIAKRQGPILDGAIADPALMTKIFEEDGTMLELGNLDSRRDWGYAGDYVEGMYLMLQANVPDDYVLATGETHTVREFVEAAVKAIGHTIEWEGQGVDEVGKIKGVTVVKINPNYYRPVEVHLLRGDATKAKTILGWEPKVKFSELVDLMVKADL